MTTEEIITPVKVSYTAQTASGELISGEAYTLSKNSLTEVYKFLAAKFNKEKVIKLCLQY